MLIDPMFTQMHNRVIWACGVECKLQGSGEESVHCMVEAWDAAYQMIGPPERAGILLLGFLVEPLKNRGGFRQCGVRVGSWIAPPWHVVPRMIDELVRDVNVIDHNAWFKAYEEIHPFVDGNGRTGLILYNWLNGSLTWPVWPTNWFNDPRRTKGFGA